MYVTLLVNTYCLQFPFNLAYFRERKKKDYETIVFTLQKKNLKMIPQESLLNL